MPPPTITMPLAGTDPKVARIEDLEAQIDAGFEALYSEASTSSSLAGVAELNTYSGTADAITANTNVANVNVGSGFKVSLRVQAANTGADPTLAINAGTAYPIRENGNTALAAGALKVDRFYVLRLSGSDPDRRWEIMSTGLTLGELSDIATETDIADALTLGGVLNLNNYGGTAQATTADTNVGLGQPVTLQSGLKIKFRPPSTNTAPDPTLALDGGDAFPIRDNGDTALAAGDLVAGRLYDLRLTGSSPNQRWEVSNIGLTIAEVKATSSPGDVVYLGRAAAESAFIVAGQQTLQTIVNGLRLVYVRGTQNVALTTADGATWVPAGDPQGLHYTENTTPGTTNVTDAVRATFAFAAATRRTARFDSFGVGLIDTDAEITINSNWDFSGMTIHGNEAAAIPNPLASDVTLMFIVEDDTTPVLTGTVTTADTLTQSNFAIGSINAATDFFTHVGYVRFALNNGFAIPNRQRDPLTTASDQWEQALWCTRNGLSVFPLAVDLSSTTSVTYYARRVSDRGWYRGTGMTVNMDTFNHCQVLTIRRNCVKITDTTVVPGDTPVSDTCNRIFYTEDAGQVILDTVTGTAQADGGNGSGTYVFRARGAAEIYLKNFSASDGWGATAMDIANGVYISDSEINRFDTHGLSGNMFALRVTFTGLGMAYGASFGHVQAIICRAIDCPVIYARGDHGGYCHGDILALGCTNVGNKAEQFIVDLQTDPIGVEGFSLPAAHSIRIDGFQHSLANDNGNGTTINPLALAVLEGEVVAPDLISISDVRGFRFRLRMPISYSDMTRRDNGILPQLIMSHINATRFPGAATDGLYIPPNTITDSGDFRVQMWIDHCTELFINLGAYDGAEIVSDHNTLRGVRLGSNGQRFKSQGDEYLDAVVSATEVLGSPAGSSRLSSQIINGEFGTGWDLSNVSLLMGVRYDDAAIVTLPSGVTRAQAFSGYASADWTD